MTHVSNNATSPPGASAPSDVDTMHPPDAASPPGSDIGSQASALAMADRIRRQAHAAQLYWEAHLLELKADAHEVADRLRECRVARQRVGALRRAATRSMPKASWRDAGGAR